MAASVPDRLDDPRNARRHAFPAKRLTDAGDDRIPSEHDRDRILYSSAFRRLSGITQVASPTELHPVHNRLTHSLKVAQIGRSLAVRLLRSSGQRGLIDDLGGLDPIVVEAAAFAHDLGHPPFGHIAERALDDLLVAGGTEHGVPDGYDGNAQSFRIVTKLATRYEEVGGLNLTRATLNALLKYPWRRASEGRQHEKWGVFHAEGAEFEWCRAGLPVGADECTLEASLMDWADDIAYGVHDVEDFFRAGLIPLDRLTTDARERDRFLDAAIAREGAAGTDAERLKDAFVNGMLMQFGPIEPFLGSSIDRATLRGLTSKLIGRYIKQSVALGTDSGRAVLRIDPDMAAEVRILKALTRHYVIESPSLVAQRFGQRTLIASLFTTFCEAATSRGRRDWTIFPVYYREALRQVGGDTKQVKRIVADLIASMSEAQVVAVHQRLTGQSLGSAMEAYLQ